MKKTNNKKIICIFNKKGKNIQTVILETFELYLKNQLANNKFPKNINKKSINRISQK